MDIEASLISSLLVDPTNLQPLKEAWDAGLRDSVFVDPLNRSVYRFVVDYHQRSHMRLVPTVDVVTAEFPSFELEDSQESVSWLVEALQTRFLRNNLSALLTDAAKRAGDGDEREAIQKLVEEAVTLQQVISKRDDKSNMKLNVNERLARYDRVAEFSGSVRGAPTGFLEVDEHTSGILPGELAAIGAYTGKGKSHVLGWSALHAVRAGFRPLIITLELSVSEFENRIDAYHSGLASSKISKGQLSFDEYEEFKQKQQEFESFGDFFVEAPPIGERKIPNFITRARDLGADFLLIDQLSFVETRKDYRTEKERVKERIMDLKAQISDDAAGKIPCLMAIQFNRASQQRKNERGKVSDFSDAIEIEQTLDMAFGLTQSREHRMNDSAVLELLKFRRGPRSAWLLEWKLMQETRFGVRQVLDDWADD